MSTAVVRRTILDDPAERELARWPGVTWRREIRSKHYALVVTFDGRSRTVVYSCSPGDSYRGALNHITNLRAELRALGATRLADPKRQAPRRHRARPDREVTRYTWEVPDPDKGPLRDPFAVLATLNIAQPVAVVPPTVADEQPRRMSLIERASAWLKSLLSRPNSPKIQRDRGA